MARNKREPNLSLATPLPLACKYKKGLCMRKCAVVKCKWMKVMVFGIDKTIG
jgi:hypothetical protein